MHDYNFFFSFGNLYIAVQAIIIKIKFTALKAKNKK